MFYTTFNSAPIIGHIAEISGARARRYPLIISETFNFFASAIEQPVTGKCEIPAGCGHLTFNPSKRSRHRCGPVDFNEKGKIVLASRQKESLRKKRKIQTVCLRHPIEIRTLFIILYSFLILSK